MQPAYEPSERRPIASRETAWANSIARWLARRGASANAISVAGMFAAIFAGGCFVATSQLEWPWIRVAWICAALGAQLRLLANLFDGMVAIASGKASRVGELYNEVPDRVSDAAIFVGMGYATGGDPVLGCAAALAAVFTAYVRAQAKAAGAPNDFGGPMAKPQRMFVVTLAALYCGLTPAWMQPALYGMMGVPALALAIIAVGCVLTAVLRLRRATLALNARTAHGTEPRP